MEAQCSTLKGRSWAQAARTHPTSFFGRLIYMLTYSQPLQSASPWMAGFFQSRYCMPDTKLRALSPLVNCTSLTTAQDPCQAQEAGSRSGTPSQEVAEPWRPMEFLRPFWRESLHTPPAFSSVSLPFFPHLTLFLHPSRSYPLSSDLTLEDIQRLGVTRGAWPLAPVQLYPEWRCAFGETVRRQIKLAARCLGVFESVCLGLNPPLLP